MKGRNNNTCAHVKNCDNNSFYSTLEQFSLPPVGSEAAVLIAIFCLLPVDGDFVSKELLLVVLNRAAKRSEKTTI